MLLDESSLSILSTNTSTYFHLNHALRSARFLLVYARFDLLFQYFSRTSSTSCPRFYCLRSEKKFGEEKTHPNVDANDVSRELHLPGAAVEDVATDTRRSQQRCLGARYRGSDVPLVVDGVAEGHLDVALVVVLFVSKSDLTLPFCAYTSRQHARLSEKRRFVCTRKTMKFAIATFFGFKQYR